MKKNYFLLMLVMLLGISTRAMAQASHKITLVYDQAAFKKFFVYNSDETLCDVNQGSTPIEVPDGAYVYMESIELNPGYELVDVLVNEKSAQFKANRTRANFGKIYEDTEVKVITKTSSAVVESFPVNFQVKGETPQGCFLSVWKMVSNGSVTKVTSGENIEKGTKIKISWGVSADYNVEILVNGEALPQDVLTAKNHTVTVEKEMNIEAAFTSKNPVVTTHNITLVAEPSTSGEVTMTSNGAAVGGGTSGNTVEHGADLVISIKPNMGQDIDDVLINNVSVKANLTDGAEGEKTYTIASVEEDVLVNVTFKQVAYRVAYLVTPAEGGVLTLTSGDATVENGAEVAYASPLTVTIAPAAGFTLASLVINDADVTAGVVDNVYTIESVTEAKAINVTFAKEETPKADYCRPEGTDNMRVNHQRTRLITNLTFDGLTKDGQPFNFSKQPNQPGDSQTEVYRDFTSDIIECTQGDEVTVSFTRYNLEWMHYYLYIDYNQDGVFDIDNEVVSYSYYSETEADGPGKNGQSDVLPQFTIPATALTGQTRIRFKVDWNSLDPCGNPASNNKIGANGGHIFDFTLNINKAGDVPVVPEYNVTVSTVGEGTITLRGENNEVVADAVTEYTGQFQEDAFLNLAVAPAEGWTLGSVMMNDADMTEEIIDGNMSFVVGSDINFVVTYVEEAPATQYTLTVTTEGQGNLMLLSEEGVLNPMFTTLEENFDEDAYLGIAFSAADGWELGSLLVNGEERIADVAYGGYEFTMTQDMNIEVKFVEKQSTDGHLITLTTEGEGVVNMAVVNGGDVMSGDRVSNGADLMLYIYPDQEWEVKAVVINGVDVTASYVATTNELKVANITEDQNIVVTFSQKVGIDSNLAEAVCYDAAAQLFVAPAEAQVELFNITGAKVAEAQGNLNMAAMNRGLYLAKVTLSGKAVVVKIAK